MTIKKIIILVNVLARLHNFCVGELPEDDGNTIPEELVPEELDVDRFNIMNQADGYVCWGLYSLGWPVCTKDRPYPTQILKLKST